MVPSAPSHNQNRSRMHQYAGPRARNDSSLRAMKAVVFNLNAMLADMEPLLRRLTTDTIDLGLVQAAGLWPVAAPPGRLEELLLALAVDACDAMEDGGGTLLLATGNLPAPQGLPTHDAVVLSVSHS